jgi:hypothetical protein
MNARELVDALGGPARLGRALGVSIPAICKAYTHGFPARHHLSLWRMAKRAGLPWRPPGADGLDLVETTGGAASVCVHCEKTETRPQGEIAAA